jgi:mRNA-degrading endonuclease toxin of MazEF toxin-antitoxin module
VLALPALELGRIIWADLPSSDGTSTKRRPAVIVTFTEEITADDPSFLVVAATTKFTEPLPDDHVLLPWHRHGKVRTQLRQPTAAVCTWLFELRESDIQKYGGIVPPDVMLEIAKIVARRESE